MNQTEYVQNASVIENRWCSNKTSIWTSNSKQETPVLLADCFLKQSKIAAYAEFKELTRIIFIFSSLHVIEILRVFKRICKCN